MEIDCVSDLHGSFPEMQGGDLLIVAGDCTSNDRIPAWKNFFDWIKAQKYRKKIYIAGNHDGFLRKCLNSSDQQALYKEYGYDQDLKPDESLVYLRDSGTEFEGLKIWGSPWTRQFGNWHFMLSAEKIKAKWDLIPNDTDILITHGPPHGILDTNEYNDRCGCEELRIAVERVKPALHIFGHIHGGYGCKSEYYPCGKLLTSVNCAHMDEDYEPVNSPIRVVL